MSRAKPKTPASAKRSAKDPFETEKVPVLSAVKASNRARLRRSRAMQILWGEEPIVEHGAEVYAVPSQSGGRPYVVNLARKSCECPHWRKTRETCKHMEAAILFRAHSRLGDGEAIVDIEPQPSPYQQPPWYDRAKENEAWIVRDLLRDLAQIYSPVPGGAKGGRPCVHPGDLIIAGTLAAYDDRPSRKAVDRGLLRGLLQNDDSIASITLRRYMIRDEFREYLYDAIRTVARCTRTLEGEFAFDGTYMKTPLSQIHIQRAANGVKAVRKILTAKLHLAAGTETLMIYGVRVVDGHDSDQNSFIPLLNQIAPWVTIDRILADAGYCDAEHYQAVAKIGAEAYIDFKQGLVGNPKFPHYHKQYLLWKEHHDAWLEIYSYRYLIECVNSMLKRSIKKKIRARREESREAEVLLAVLAYNLCRLIIARIEHGIDIPWAAPETLANIDALKEPRRRGKAAA